MTQPSDHPQQPSPPQRDTLMDVTRTSVAFAGIGVSTCILVILLFIGLVMLASCCMALFAFGNAVQSMPPPPAP